MKTEKLQKEYEELKSKNKTLDTELKILKSLIVVSIWKV